MNKILYLFIISLFVFIGSCGRVSVTNPGGTTEPETTPTEDQLFRAEAAGTYTIACYSSGPESYHIIGVVLTAGDVTSGPMSVSDRKFTEADCNDGSIVYESTYNMTMTSGAVTGETNQERTASIPLDSVAVVATKINATVQNLTLTVYTEDAKEDAEDLYGVSFELGVAKIVQDEAISYYGYLYLQPSGGITMSVLMPNYTNYNNRALFDVAGHLTASPVE